MPSDDARLFKEYEMQVTFSQNVHTLGFTLIAYSTLAPIVRGMVDVFTVDEFGNMISIMDNMDALNYYCE